MGVERNQVLVPAVDRAIQILSTFESGEELLGVSDISRRLDLNKSTVHDILATLAHHGWLERDDGTKRYRLGPSLAHLGSRAAAPIRVEDVARASMVELAAQVEESVMLGVATDDDHILIVAVVEPDRDLKITASVGRRLYHSAGAPARIFHAARSEEELQALLSRRPLRAFTAQTITDPRLYRRGLEEVRRTGYALDNEEYLEGVRAVAAPVADRRGAVIAALYVVGFRSRLTPERMQPLTGLVSVAARRVSEQLGARVYPSWNGVTPRSSLSPLSSGNGRTTTPHGEES